MKSLIKTIKKWLRIPNVKVVTFIFRGWVDERLKAEADGGNIDFLDEEISARRRGPAHPPGLWFMTTDAGYRAVLGTKILVHLEPEVISSKQVLDYLAQLGIDAVEEKKA